MNRTASLLFLLLLPNGFSEELFPPGYSPQSTAGCPVYIQHASFERPARMMLAASEDNSSPSLRLQMQNSTLKPIKSVDVSVRVLYKEGRYQLDAAKKSIALTVSDQFTQNGMSAASIQLPQSVLGIDLIVLNRIEYRDGSVWSAARDEMPYHCTYRLQGATSRIAK